MGQVPAKYFPPSAPYGSSPAANVLNPSQPAAANPQTPLLPPNFQDPGTMQQSNLAQSTGIPSMSGGGGSNNELFRGRSRMFGRGLFGLIAILYLSASSWATTTVTGTLKNLGTGTVSGGAFVRFWLRGCQGVQPRVNGNAVIAPTQGGVYFQDFVADVNGNISGTVYSTRDATGNLNGEIECPTSVFTATWYGVQLFLGGKAGPETPVAAKNGATLNVTNVTPLSASPVVTAPTGDTVYLRLDGGNSPVTGPVTFNNSLTVSGTTTLSGPTTINCKKINHVLCVDDANTQGWAGTDQGQWINAAMASGIGDDTTVWVFGSGTWSTNIWAGISKSFKVEYATCASITVSATQTPNFAYQKLIGVRPGCTTIFLNNATFNLLTPAATNFEFGNFMVRTNVTRTAGWVVLPSGGGSFGYYHDLYFLDTYNGIGFIGAGGSAPSNQNIERLITNESTGTHSGTMVQAGGGDGSGVSAIVVTHWLDAGDLSTHDTPKLVMDTGLDTFHISDMNAAYSQGNPSTQPVIAIQKSVIGGSNIAPRWVTFDGHTSIEGGYDGIVTGADCVSITAGNSIVFQRLYAISCNRGVVIGNTNSAPTGIKINSGVIVSNKAGGVVNTTAVTNLGLELGAIDFVNNSRATTNTTDDVSILAGTTGFKIIGSSFGTNNLGTPAQKSRYGINLGGAGTDVFSVLGIDCNPTNLGTNCINDPATALNAVVQNGFDSAGQAALKIYSNCPSSNVCLEIKNTNPGGQSWRVGEFYANGNLAFRNSVTGTGYTFVGNGGNFERRFNSTLTAARDWTFPDVSGTAVLDPSSTSNGSFPPTGAWQCTNVTPVTVNANVATDQNLMACTVPAGTLNRVGRTLRVKVAGVYSTPAASTSQMTLKLKLCTVSGCGSGTVVTPISIQSTALGTVQITNDNFSLRSELTTQTAGASSAYEAHGEYLIDLATLATAADSVFGDGNTATVGTIDSTAQLFLQCTFAFSAASASNSATQRQLIAETVN